MSGASVLEYARFHGIAIDHRSEDVLKLLHQHTFLRSGSPADADVEVPELDFSQFAPPPEEPKLQLSRGGTEILAQSIRPPEYRLRWDDFLPDPHWKKKLKIEAPLLLTDHEADVADFKRDARRGPD